MSDPRATALKRIGEERAELAARSEKAEKSLPALNRKYEAARAKHYAFGDHDADESDAQRKARVAHEAALKALWSTLDAISSLAERIARLDDPHEVEKRTATQERVAGLRQRYGNKEGTTMATKTLDEKERAEITKKVVAAVKATGSFTAAAEKLNKAKVPTLGRSAEWYAQIVRGVSLRTGEKFTLKPQNGTPSGKRTTRPDPKPKRKARKVAGRR